MECYGTLTAGKGIRRTTLHFSYVNGGGMKGRVVVCGDDRWFGEADRDDSVSVAAVMYIGVRSERACVLPDGPGRLVEGAVGRSESALAFSIGLLRMIGKLPDVGYRLTTGSCGGGTSGIARFCQILPTRKLGSFRSQQLPLLSTVSGYTESVPHVHLHQDHLLSDDP